MDLPATSAALEPGSTPEGAAPDARAVNVGQSSAPDARSGSRRRTILTIGFVVVALAAAGILIAVALTQARPRWWRTLDPTSPATIATAEAVENGVASALTQVRPAASVSIDSAQAAGDASTAWKVFITDEQANAWLNVRLKPWLADQTEQGAIDFKWPAQVKEVQVRFEPGVIHIGARVADRPEPGGGTHTLAARLRPAFGDDGALWMLAERIDVGRLPLPARWVLGSPTQQRLGEVSDQLARLPQTRRVLEALRGDRPVLSRPLIKLADGRRVRLLAIEPADGRLVITCRTEQRRTAAAD